MSNQMDTIWSKLDRKATAIAEFTMRQYRTRISTWAVMGAGLMAILLMLLFYIDAMGTDIDPIDNDGDSFDSDGDGSPDGYGGSLLANQPYGFVYVHGLTVEGSLANDDDVSRLGGGDLGLDVLPELDDVVGGLQGCPEG